MEHFALVKFTLKRGIISKCLTSKSLAILKLWALQNTSDRHGIIVFSIEDGSVKYMLSGYNVQEIEQDDNIENHCYGILQKLQIDLCDEEAEQELQEMNDK